MVEVLTICEDFGLNQLGDRILEQPGAQAELRYFLDSIT